ncbi:MAG: 3-deoxy-8-phosphooctulonate synthase [Rhodobacteraceae bacterium]|nr:3-deoxy-8-phosphooctulonate synthase [Paracoccaceae bacterium]
MKSVAVGGLRLANNLPFVLIAGPCQIESESHALMVAARLKDIAAECGVGLIFKSSFDKANRTSVNSARGAGMDDGLKALEAVKSAIGCPVLTDVHETWQCEPVAEVVDVLQIPAFLCRQTDLITAAARTGRALNVKKGQFLAPWDMANVVAKAESAGNERLMLCERGSCFGYNTLVTDMRSLPELAASGYPVVIDATHSVQQPGGRGRSSGGQREHVPTVARAAVAVGVAAVFMETHEDPDRAPSDGPNMIPLDDLTDLVRTLVELDRIVKGRSGN